MDHPDGLREDKEKRISSHEEDNSKNKKFRSSTSSGLGFGSEAKAGSASEVEPSFIELLSQQIKPFLSHLVQVEVKKSLDSFLETLRERKEAGEEVIIESGIEEFKLAFYNEIPSVFFTNNDIKADNGELLAVVICDAKTNVIISSTPPLSSAQIEFFILDGEYNSANNLSDLNQSILSERDGKRPLIVGGDQKPNLVNGFFFIKNLCITDNSSWTKSKKFRLGARVINDNILAQFPNIGVAVSKPFRVMDHRGEVNQKRHPPSRDDELWRLEGIGKDGIYHKNLCSHGIKNVGDFIHAYQVMGWIKLKKLLGNKVPKKIWTMMVENAFECVNVVPNRATMGAVTNEAFNNSGEVFDQQTNLVNGFETPSGITSTTAFGNGLGYFDPAPLFFEEFGAISNGAAAAQGLAPNISMKDMTKLAP